MKTKCSLICRGLLLMLAQGVMLLQWASHVYATEWALEYEAALQNRAELQRLDAEIMNQLLAPTQVMAAATRSASALDRLDPDLQAVWVALQEEAESLFAEGSLASIDSQGGVVEFAADFLGDDSLEYAMAMLRLGQMLLLAGDVASAGGFIETASESISARLGPAHVLALQARAEMAQLYIARNEVASATELLEQLIDESSQSLGPAHELSQRFGQQLETVLSATGQSDVALERLATRCRSLERVTGPWYSGAQACLLSLADALVAAGDDARAETQLELYLAREQAKVEQDINGLVMADETMAQIESRTGRLDRALERIDRRLSLTGLSEQTSAKLSFTKTQILMIEGALDDAGAVLQAYSPRARAAWQDDPHQLAILSNQEAELAQRKGALNDAEKLFRQSLNESANVLSRGDPLALVLRNNLGQLYESMGLFEEAEPLLKEVVALAELQRGANHPDTARQRNNLALLYESQGRFDFAEPLYKQAIEALRAAYGESAIEVINLQNNLAFLQFMKEDFTSARLGFEHVLAQWAQVAALDHPERLKAQNNLGRVLLAETRFAEAEQIFVEVLAMRRAKLGDQHLDVVRSMIDLGQVYIAQQRFDEAAQQLRSALGTAEAVLGEEHPYTFDALNALAKARKGQGDDAQALDLMREGFLRRTRFFDRVLWVTGENAREGYLRLHRQELSDYLASLAEMGGLEAAKRVLEVSLMRKGLLLKITSEIQQISQFSQDAEMADLASKLRLAREALAKLTLSGPTDGSGENHVAQLNELEAEVDELQGLLGRASVRYRASVANLSVQDVVREIEPESALFDVQVYESEGEARYLVAGYQGGLGDDGYFLVDLGPASAIDESVSYHREIIQDPNADDFDFEEAGLEAYELVFGPLEDVLGEVTHAYIIPDGLLNIAPFPAMFTNEGNYLIEQLDLQILTSSRDLIPSERRRAVGDYIIMAGPDYDATNREESATIARVSELQAKRSQTLRGAGSGLRGLNFLPLPGAEKEGEIIAETIESLDLSQTIYNRAQAEEAIVSGFAESPRVLHIATHGFFLQPDQNLRNRLLSLQRGADLQLPPPGDNPLLRAGLAFAGINKKAPLLGEIDPSNDGVLTALEVLDLQLSGTHLVVLSACETGLGEIHEGEGVYGLRRAFQEAGVAEVVNSLWEVSDAGTQALMSAFYSRMMSGQTAREALRGAQLELKDSNLWRSPYVWSAFMMVGSYDTSGIKES